MGYISQKFRAHYIEALKDFGENIPLHMQLIPAGTFAMGFSKAELEYKYGRPQQEVTVFAFFLGRYPVTQAQ